MEFLLVSTNILSSPIGSISPTDPGEEDLEVLSSSLSSFFTQKYSLWSEGRTLQ